eukprot:scaffold4350_cov69-Cylindrotheca_fusiformis.AAC.1
MPILTRQILKLPGSLHSRYTGYPKKEIWFLGISRGSQSRQIPKIRNAGLQYGTHAKSYATSHSLKSSSHAEKLLLHNHIVTQEGNNLLGQMISMEQVRIN